MGCVAGNKPPHRGFALVELLVVIALLLPAVHARRAANDGEH